MSRVRSPPGSIMRRHKVGVGKRGFAFSMHLIGQPEDRARTALPDIRSKPLLQKQLLLFTNRIVVERTKLNAICKWGLPTLIAKGLVAGKKGGKKFFITPAGVIVLRELAQCL